MEGVNFQSWLISNGEEEVINGERDPNSAGELENDQDFSGEKRDCIEKNPGVHSSKEEI